MNYLKVRNWDKWQTYRKDRGQPPWIKLHRELLRNPEWVSLTDAQRGHLVVIWLLAADHNGAIPASPQLIRKIGLLDEDPDLELFIEQGFIECDANVTPPRRQGDAPETEAEAEVEVDKPPFPPFPGLNTKAWDDYTTYRRDNKMRKLKPGTVKQQRLWLVGQGDESVQRRIVDETTRNGWTGLFELKNNGAAKSSEPSYLQTLKEMHDENQ